MGMSNANNTRRFHFAEIAAIVGNAALAAEMVTDHQGGDLITVTREMATAAYNDTRNVGFLALARAC